MKTEKKTKRSVSEFNSELKLRGFNVFQIEKDANSTRTYSRKDFYKICLTTGRSKIHIRNYIHLIIHEALKMQPSENYDQHKNAASRLTSVFLELLERQFPIESSDHPLPLRTPQDYANYLSVHVNYLNSSVKAVTGKPTSGHISDRVVSEARALLQHTNWNISEIAYALGFEYPTYFSNFFKKLTGTTPRAVRTSQL